MSGLVILVIMPVMTELRSKVDMIRVSLARVRHHWVSVLRLEGFFSLMTAQFPNLLVSACSICITRKRVGPWVRNYEDLVGRSDDDRNLIHLGIGLHLLLRRPVRHPLWVTIFFLKST